MRVFSKSLETRRRRRGGRRGGGRRGTVFKSETSPTAPLPAHRSLPPVVVFIVAVVLRRCAGGAACRELTHNRGIVAVRRKRRRRRRFWRRGGGGGGGGGAAVESLTTFGVVYLKEGKRRRGSTHADMHASSEHIHSAFAHRPCRKCPPAAALQSSSKPAWMEGLAGTLRPARNLALDGVGSIVLPPSSGRRRRRRRFWR